MEYLDKFRKKPNPKKQKAIQIAMPKEDIELDVNIVDKRKSIEMNRTQLLEKIMNVDKGVVSKKTEQTEQVEKPSAPARPTVPDEQSEMLIIKPKKRKKRTTKRKVDIPSIALDETTIKGMLIGDTIVSDREGKNPLEVVRYSSYYLNNRQVFMDSIASMFDDYRHELIEEDSNEPSCAKSGSDFSLLIHQKIIRDYMIGGYVLGYPLNMDSSEGPRCQSIRDFGLEFSKQLSDEFKSGGKDPWVCLWDERLSTVSVEDLVDNFVEKRKTKIESKASGLIDKLAAQIILQGAVDYLT